MVSARGRGKPAFFNADGLKAAGVVSADTAQAYKPHREMFDEALRISG